MTLVYLYNQILNLIELKNGSIKEVEKKLEKEIQSGYLPVENEVEVIEKLMLSLVLEAKRNSRKSL